MVFVAIPKKRTTLSEEYEIPSSYTPSHRTSPDLLLLSGNVATGVALTCRLQCFSSSLAACPSHAEQTSSAFA